MNVSGMFQLARIKKGQYDMKKTITFVTAMFNGLKSMMEEAYRHREVEYIKRESARSFMEKADNLLLSTLRDLKAA